MDVKEKLIEIVCDAMESDGCICHCNHSPCFEVERVVNALIAHGVTVQEWISVDDRLPEEKVNCIVHYKHAYCDNDDYWAIGLCFYDGEKFRIDLSYKVTHWMPLPQPPKGETNNA